jgi:hypothetical protein
VADRDLGSTIVVRLDAVIVIVSSQVKSGSGREWLRPSVTG